MGYDVVGFTPLVLKGNSQRNSQLPDHSFIGVISVALRLHAAARGLVMS